MTDRDVRSGLGGVALPTEGLGRLLPGAIWIALSVAAAVYVFAEGFNELWRAWQTPEYSHGPLIPVISGYLFLRQIKHMPAADVSFADRLPGVVVVILSLLLGFAGKVAHIDDIVAYAIIVWVAGMVLTSWGWSRGKHLWPPVLHLVFMLPLPATLYWKVSIALQLISSEIGVAFIRAMTIPVYLDGNIIDLGIYRLHVAEACSGLRYLFPVMSFTYIFAVLYQGSVWHKGVLLLAAVPITVLMNSIRIGIIGVMVDNYGIEHAEGFLHLFEGWVIFLTVIAVMFAMARAMQKISGDRRSFAEVLDLDTSGLGEQIMRVGDVRGSVPMIAVILLLAGTGAAWQMAPEPERAPIERQPFVVFPNSFDGWIGAGRRRLEPDIERVLKADDYLSIRYVPEGATLMKSVDFFVAWYEDQSRGGVHSPEVCIPTSGWEMSEIQRTEIPVQLTNRSISLPVNRAVIQKGGNRQLVYYWFDQRGRRLTSDYMAKAYLLIDGLQTGRTDGALLRLITSIGVGETERDADERLQALLGPILEEMPRFINTQN